MRIGSYLGRHVRFVRSYLGRSPWRLVSTHVLNRMRYSHVAHPLKVIWASPFDISRRLVVPRQLANRWRYGLVHDGDWDRTSVKDAQDTTKVRSMRQRFEEGRPWEETDLFRDRYARMLAAGVPVRGQTTLADLARTYERIYGSLFDDIATRGIVGPTVSDPASEHLQVHIGRSGELLGTSDGNHRLGMALVLRLDKVPLRVATRHEAWQRIRVSFARAEDVDDRHLEHPDLDDLLALRLKRPERHSGSTGEP